jgi:L-alanine-DL-glutamate epimerase-like enolase superfamily enzyme
MKITRLETIPVCVPLKPGLTTKTAHGEHVDSPYVIVRVHTNEGLTGLGEATLSPRWSGETSPGCVAVIQGLFAPLLIGQDPLNITAANANMNSALRNNPFTKAAVEMALWDLAGKFYNLPCFQLLGGRVRENLPVKLIIGGFNTEKTTELTEQFLEWGARCLKVKVGIDPEADLQRVRTVRELAGPEIPIGIDANQGWSLKTAIRILPQLEPLNILFAEQPIRGDDPADFTSLRKHTNIPLMADESLFTATDARLLARQAGIDLFSVCPGKHGGLQATQQICCIASAAGKLCSMGSNLELGVGTAAMLHLATALPEIASEQYPGDFVGPFYHVTDLLDKPLALGPPFSMAPTGPGLGVSLNEAELEKYRDHSATARPLGN